MTGNEQRNGAKSSSPTAAAPEAAETAGEAAEKGACVATGVGRCGGCEANGDGGEREEDRMCRICHLSSRSGEGGSELILLVSLQGRARLRAPPLCRGLVCGKGQQMLRDLWRQCEKYHNCYRQQGSGGRPCQERVEHSKST
ncbi:hypothetical protein ZIOFF_040638 [Zingiber officinale]|uniref:Uncharacterized protein n=1 Tax=Zingiber officinale TaxID=94328 RepID=A0A8J5KVC7_ZINOF|nr:hypothetical protein ZIOFF_040638 [Zingiber officinale]